jgi:hypothetical protein
LVVAAPVVFQDKEITAPTQLHLGLLLLPVVAVVLPTTLVRLEVLVAVAVDALTLVDQQLLVKEIMVVLFLVTRLTDLAAAVVVLAEQVAQTPLAVRQVVQALHHLIQVQQ